MVGHGDRSDGTEGLAVSSRGLGCGTIFAGLLLVGLLASFWQGLFGGSVPALPSATAPMDVPAEQRPESLLGTIEFGTKYDPDTLEMTRAAHRFHASAKSIAYVIHLSEAAGSTSLTLTLTRRTSGGAETTIATVPFEVANPDFDTFANWYDFAAFADRELGTYVLRIVREGKLLAEGTFRLVK